MPHAIIRGANGRRHEVDFDGGATRVEVYSNEDTIEIVIEAADAGAPSGKGRFALLNLPRDQFSAALGQAAQSKRAVKPHRVA